MKQMICALSVLVLVSIGVCIYIVPLMKEWVGHGENNYKNAIIIIVIFAVARPLAWIVCGIAKIFFPNKPQRSEFLI